MSTRRNRSSSSIARSACSRRVDRKGPIALTLSQDGRGGDGIRVEMSLRRPGRGVAGDATSDRQLTSGPMAQLLALHALLSLTAATAAGNAVLTAWAIVAHRRRQSTLGSALWTLRLLVLVVLAVQIATGVVAAGTGARPKTSLHFLYGVLVTAGPVVQL